MAREQALAYHINQQINGNHAPTPEVEHWLARAREAFERELARRTAEAACRP